MSKRKLLICSLLALPVMAAVISWTHLADEVMAKVDKETGQGDSYTVRVTRSAHSVRTDLLLRGQFHVSSYEFHVSVPPKKVAISWPKLGEFVVILDNEVVLKCTWDEIRGVMWERIIYG